MKVKELIERLSKLNPEIEIDAQRYNSPYQQTEPDPVVDIVDYKGHAIIVTASHD